MIIEVVPIKKIRATVSSFYYLVPERRRSQIIVGVRVIIPFRTQEIVGVVWRIVPPTVSLKNIEHQLKSVIEVLDVRPFLTERSREFFDWIADFYLTALPTVLAMAVPPSYCRLSPRQRPTQLAAELSPAKSQALILAPYLDYPGIEKIRFRPDFIEYSQKLNQEEETEVWRQIDQGQKLVVFGTYRPIYLPFKNLEQITIIEPENDLLKYEQSPKIHLATAARKLAAIWGAKLVTKTHQPLCPVLIVDISLEKELINFQTENWLQTRLEANRRIIVFYNFFDLSAAQDKFDVKALAADLKTKLPKVSVSVIKNKADFEKGNWSASQIVIGTAQLLFLPEIIKGDLLIPNIDFDLARSNFQPKKLLARIAKLGRFSQEILIQTKKPANPFLFNLSRGTTDDYLGDFYRQKKQAGQYPFGFWLRLIFSDQAETVCQEETEKLALQMETLFAEEVETFGPSPVLSSQSTKKFYWQILIKLRQDQVSKELRAHLLKLPHPWQIDPHPVNLN